MDAMAAPALTVVIAVKGGQGNLAAILERLSGVDPRTVEILFCVAGPAPDALKPASARHRVIAAEEAALVPHLWRDGLVAARSDRVALTTAQFVPPEDWIAGLLAADLVRWAGVGGPIENDAEANPVRWAVYFLRYWKFAPPLPMGPVEEIAADNAVYDRGEVMKHADLLARGFWEPSFHARFRADGRGLGLDARLLSLYRGHDGVDEFSRQRFAHGRTFAETRAQGGSRAKAAAYLLATPLLPPLLTGRIMSKALRRRRLAVRFFQALPWLLVFVTAWSAGEAAGYLKAAFGARD